MAIMMILPVPLRKGAPVVSVLVSPLLVLLLVAVVTTTMMMIMSTCTCSFTNVDAFQIGTSTTITRTAKIGRMSVSKRNKMMQGTTVQTITTTHTSLSLLSDINIDIINNIDHLLPVAGPVAIDTTTSTTTTSLSSTSSIPLLQLISSSETNNVALDTLRTILITITSLIFGLAGLTYIVASFIIPKAAEQLENDTKRLRPGLWEEYELKLKDGETMAMRPDLLQELGNIMQPIIIQDYEDKSNTTSAGSASSANKNGDNYDDDKKPSGGNNMKTMTNMNQWDD